MRPERVGQITVSNVNTATGAMFNSSGNLVFIGQDNRYEVLVREVNASGQVLRQYDTGSGGLNRGSYIDFDPIRHIYAFADDDHLTFLDSNLCRIGATANVFQRASGVAFGADGCVFAGDQSDYRVYKFDATFALQSVLDFPYPYGYVATGLDVADNGDLLLTSYGHGAVYRMNPETGDISQVVQDLGYGRVSSVMELPDGRLLMYGEEVVYASSRPPANFSALGVA